MDVWIFDDVSSAALIKAVLANRRIQMWTTFRLPYEPHGIPLAVRNHLRTWIPRLAAESDQMLEARYRATEDEFVDTENVLIYNVGTSVFSKASRFGLRFIREFGDPPNVQFGDFTWRHHHSYELIPRSSFQQNGTTQFRFSLSRLNSSLKPHVYWLAAKLGHVQTDNAPLTRPFRLSATVTGPSLRCGLSAIIKSLFDGVISALHCYSGTDPTGVVCTRLATVMQISPHEVAPTLTRF